MAPSQLPAGSSTVFSKNTIVIVSLIAFVLFSWTAVFFVKRSRSSAQKVESKTVTGVSAPSTSRRLLQSVRGVFSCRHEVVADVEACPQPLLQATGAICNEHSSAQASPLKSSNAPVKNAQVMASVAETITKDSSMQAVFLESFREAIKAQSSKESHSASPVMHQHDLAVAFATSPVRVLFSISECDEDEQSEEDEATVSMEADVSVLQDDIAESPAHPESVKGGKESFAPEVVATMPLAPSPYRPLFPIDECEEYAQVQQVPTKPIKNGNRAVGITTHISNELLEGSAPFYVLSRSSVQAYCVPIDDVLTILGVPTITVTDYTWTPPAGLLASRKAPKVPAVVASDDKEDVFSASTKHNISWNIPASPSSPAKKRGFKSSSESNKENETGMEIVHGVPKTPRRRRDVVELKSCWSP